MNSADLNCEFNYAFNGLLSFLSLGIAVFITFILLWMTRFLSTDTVEGGIRSIESADNTFLPIYLGYFFVALSIPNLPILICISIILFIFIYLSQTAYFNPLFYIFRYKFYYMEFNNRSRVFLITKKEMRDVTNFSTTELKRINNFTYIDLGGKE